MSLWNLILPNSIQIKTVYLLVWYSVYIHNGNLNNISILKHNYVVVCPKLQSIFINFCVYNDKRINCKFVQMEFVYTFTGRDNNEFMFKTLLRRCVIRRLADLSACYPDMALYYCHTNCSVPFGTSTKTQKSFLSF